MWDRRVKNMWPCGDEQNRALLFLNSGCKHHYFEDVLAFCIYVRRIGVLKVAHQVATQGLEKRKRHRGMKNGTPVLTSLPTQRHTIPGTRQPM